jgi:phosphate transport system permease protein
LLYVGTKQGTLQLFESAADDLNATDSLNLGEGITALGFDLGMSALLVGGERGSLVAVQTLNHDGAQHLQLFHRFASLKGAVRGFMASQRDKRFLSWSASEVAVDHVTTEKRLASLQGSDIAFGALSARGASIAAISKTGELMDWSLDAAHPEVSAKVLWQKVHYEGYQKPEYVWQSTGGSDDFEPKLSLVPLVFGTLKGTLYAMLFALPLAILGALYTSQFATPRLRNTIKPLIEVMAALPSVVLGFVAGLVLAPLFERAAIQILVLPLSILASALILLPLWSALPSKLRNRLSLGREVIWAIPVLFIGLLIAYGVAPSFERVLMQGDYRAWLLNHHSITYDQRNSIVVGFAMGFAVIPIIFTISEDALTSVPRSLTSASLACGASPWQTAWRVVLPTASPGIFSAVMVGFGRAIGETMIVLMATGNTPVMDWNPFNGMRTLAANIAVETPEAPMHGTLYRVLFFTALLLFALTFLLNTVAELVRQHLRKRYESL